jgi:lipoprotein-releasing system ATP-binding protein
MSESPLVAIRALRKSFATADGTLDVLRGIDLDAARGEFLAIVGPSGAGKSTLLHILGTLERPTSGTVTVDGTNVFEMKDEALARFRNERIGFVFQFHHLLAEFSAEENIAIPMLMRGTPRKDAIAQSRALLETVGVGNRRSHRPAELSGGEQQRVAVARALANSPGVVLADEPSGNLDSANARALHEMLVRLCRERGQTFVVVTHNDHLAASADRIVRMEDGALVGETR